MAQYDAASQNNIKRNVRQYTDLDLFFGKKASNSDVQEIKDKIGVHTNGTIWRRITE